MSKVRIGAAAAVVVVSLTVVALWAVRGLQRRGRAREAQRIVKAFRSLPSSPLTFDTIERARPPEEAAPAPSAPAPVEHHPARVVLPAHSTDPVRIEDTGTGMAVDVQIRNVFRVDAQTADGYTVFSHAHASGGTVLHRAVEDGAEDFVSFETRPAVPEVTYDVTLGNGVSGLRLVEGTFEMLDADGAPRLRAAPPFVAGADGERTDATLAIEGCAVDTDPSPPWGRAVTAPGASICTLRVRWPDEHVVYPAVLDPRWTTTGSMTTPRQGHTATLLSTGKVLVAGGTSNGTTALASAELYDRTTGTWAATASMTGARTLHTATQLNTGSNSTTSGMVLVAGGLNGSTSQNTAQLYSPSAGTWTAATNLNAARHGQTATLLASGKVLLAGGLNGTTVLNTAALYDPSSGAGSWTATSTMPQAVKFHTATRLVVPSNGTLNNKVLIVGGNSGNASVTNVQLFDGTSSWSSLTALSGTREGHTATALANGNVLIAGGKSGSSVLNTTSLFNVASGSGSWSSAGTLTTARQLHAAVLLPSGIVENGQVLLAGGNNGSSTLSSTELWNGTTTWTATTTLPAAIQAETVTLLSNNMVLIAGGVNGSSTVATADLYDASFSLACTSNSQCATGFCVSGVCCDTACNGGCGVCNLPGKVGTCSAASTGTVCRAQNGACDVAETCDGSSLTCPTDAVAVLGAVCRSASGACDVPETCDGTTKACPADGFAPSTTVCRASAGACDAAETCTGTSATCPADSFAPATTVCRPAAGGCDVAETCTGASTICPPDALATAGTVCRPAESICDLAETCSGSSSACPTDTFAAAGTTCGAATGSGPAPVCSGAAGSCPVANGTSDILGFEAVADWTFDPSATASIVGLNAASTQGASSLEVTAQNWARLNSAPMSSIGSIGSLVLIDIQLPTDQANPGWYGDAQMFVSSPSLGINNVPLGDVGLTGLALGTWQTLAFQMPSSTATTLAGGVYSDLTFSVVLNVPYNETGHYLLDNIRSIPDVVPSLLGIAQDGATLKAIFDYQTTSSTPVNIPYGTANGLTNQNGFIAAPPEVPPTTFVSTTHAPFVATLSGALLTWTVGGHSVTATPSSTHLTTVPAGDGTTDAILPNGQKVNLDSVPPASPTPQPEPPVGAPFAGALTGELSVSPSGAAVYTVPISVPPGIAGMAPSLSLVYNSQGGFGIAGQGWQLSGLSMIHRCPKTALKDGAAGPVTMNALANEDSDGICIDGKKLYEDPVGSGSYRPEQQDFSQIQLQPDGSFQVTTKTGEVRRYGTVTRVDDAGSGQTGIWALDAVSDQWGNYFTVQYNDGQGDFTVRGLIPTRIDYTGHTTNGVQDAQPFSWVTFDYESRLDFRTTRLGQTALPQVLLLKTITTPRGAYSLTYQTNEFNTALLEEIGYSANGVSLKPLDFAWNENPDGPGPIAQTYSWSQNSNYALPPTFFSSTRTNVTDQISVAGQFVDLDADGRADFVLARDGVVNKSYSAKMVARNTGSGWDSGVGWDFPTLLSHDVNGFLVPTGVRFADMDGDGKLDIIQDAVDLACTSPDACFPCTTEYGGPSCVSESRHHASPAVWLNRLTPKGGNWEYHPEFESRPFPFNGRPDFDFNSPTQGAASPWIVADMNGDGKADVVQVTYFSETRTVGPTISFDIMLNTGVGWASGDIGSEANEVHWSDTLPYDLVPQVLDINRDGLPDLVASQYVVGNENQLDSYQVVFINKDGTLRDNSSFLAPIVHKPSSRSTALADRNGVSYGDFDGDGFYDAISFESLWGINGNQDISKFQFGVGVSDGSGQGFGTTQSIGFASALAATAPPAALQLGPSDYGYAFMDVNGDGLADLIRNHSLSSTGHGEVFVNSGRSWNAFGDPLPGWNDNVGPGAVPMVPNGTMPCVVLLQKSPLDPECSFGVNGPYAAANGSAYVDLDGDGLADVIKDYSFNKDSTDGSTSRAWINQFQRPLITGFPNQLANPTTVVYVATTSATAQGGSAPTYTDTGALDPGTVFSPVPTQVVQSIAKDTGVGSAATTTYQYTDMRGSAFGYGPQGFKTMTVTDPSGMVTTTTFSQIFPYTGMPIEVDRSNSLGKVSQTTTTYCLDGAGTQCNKTVQAQPPRTSFFAHPSYIVDVVYLPVQVETDTDYQYDDFGNPTVTTVESFTPGSHADTGTGQIFQTTTVNTYGDPGSPEQQMEQQMGKVTQTQVTHFQLAPGPTIEKMHTTQFQYKTIFGALALSKKLIEPGGGASIELDTAYDYDKFGNVITTTACASNFIDCAPGAPGPADLPFRTTRASYSVSAFNAPVGGGLISKLNYTDGRFPVMVTDALCHASFTAYDPLLGVVVQSTDTNGLHTCQTYDAVGNPVSSTSRCGSNDPLTTTVSRFQVSDPSLPREKVVTITRPPTGETTWAYTDSLGRSTVTRARHFSGRFTETDTVFDLLGRVESQSKPHMVGEFVYTTVPTYDPLSRVSNVSEVVGPLNDFGGSDAVDFTTTDFSGGLSIVTSHQVAGVPESRTETKDISGKVIAVTDSIGTTTGYSYDADGNLTDVTVGSLVLNHTMYDLRGRKMFTTDADLGTWSYTYNGFGDLISQQDAKGQVTTMSYDALGRMTSRSVAGDTSEWIYDVAPGAGIGKLAFMIGAPDPNLNGSCTLPPSASVSGGNRAIRTYQYTQFEQQAAVLDCTDGTVFPTTYEYDALGRQSEIRYPPVGTTQLAVGYHYTSLGFLQYLTDDSTDYGVLWQAKAVNALGQVTDEQARNGVETVSTRNPSTGWLLHSTATAHLDQDNLIQWLDFGYDEVGNLRSRERQDQVVDATSGELFTYDPLNRLSTSEVKVATTPSYDVTETYTYDLGGLGNLVQKGGNTYTYGGCPAGARVAGPHAICTVGGGAPFSYDDNGNMISSGSRTVKYNAANKPVHIASDPMPSQGDDTGTADFIYGADNNRVVQISTSGSTSARTVYVGLGDTGKSIYERTTTTTTGGTTTTQHVDFIYAGGAHGGNAFAVRLMADDGTAVSRYFNFDHLGSTMAITDEEGRIASSNGPDAKVLGYDPWGARRNPDGLPANPASFDLQVGHREFTGHETIPEVGLVNMNGRVYDPVLGRFLSGDPNVQFVNDLQSYNRYSYVLNNPLSVTDPTGYFLGISTNAWVNLGLSVAGIAVCAGTGGSGCGIVFALAATAFNVTSAVVAGASQDQIAATLILGGGLGIVGGQFGGVFSSDPGAGLGAHILGGAIGGAISGALSSVVSGQGHLGLNVFLGASTGAVAAGVTYALRQGVAVSEASRAQAQGDGGSGESVAEVQAREQAAGETANDAGEAASSQSGAAQAEVGQGSRQPLTREDAAAKYGRVDLASGQWPAARQYLVRYNIPQNILDDPSYHLVTPKGDLVTHFWINKDLVPMLDNAFQNLQDAGGLDKLNTFNGSFNVRGTVAGSVSAHSWGIAVDFNAATNPQGFTPTMAPVVVRAFTDAGFTWGGTFSGRSVDGMHFSLGF